MASSRNKSIVVSHQLETVPLSVLKPNQENVAIKVRVVRSWEVHIPGRGDKPVAMEMVLADDEGTKILGHLDQSHIYKFRNMLQEGAVVTISNFAVFGATGSYRPTAHECKLNLRFHSDIRPISPAQVPEPPYNFTPPEICLDKEFNKDYLVDIVGVYVRHGDETKFQSKGKTSTRMTLDLQNQGFSFTVTLFGEFTTQMKNFVDSGKAAGAVVAVLFCKVGTWPGGTSIQTTPRTSKLLFNPDIPETVLLRESEALDTTPLTITNRGQRQSLEAAFLTFDKKYTLADIRELMEVTDFVSTAMINSIVDGVEWWYWACIDDMYKCTEEEDALGLFYCPNCYKHVDKVVRRLKLKLRLHDDTEVITVTLFDNAVKMLTGRPAEEVYRTWKEDPGKGTYPTELTRLIGREGIWRIQAVKKEEDAVGRSYKVNRVSLSEELIARYNDKWAYEGTIEGPKQELLLLEDTPSDGVDGVPKSDSVVVTEELGEKLDDSGCGSTTLGESHALVDLTDEKNQTHGEKRRGDMDSASSSKVPLKSVKIEKE